MQHTLIVEDVDATGQWLQAVLFRAFGKAGITLCATYHQAKQAVDSSCFSMVLLDINLPDGSGIDLIPRIRQQCPDAYIVITTIFDDEEHILRALQAGAHGYLLKDLPEHLFVQKLQGILNGDPPISPSISRRILRYFSEQTLAPSATDVAAPYVLLSQREQEVLILVAKGLSRKDVAGRLGLSSNTIARYIRNVYQKLDISSRAEAAVEACRMGLVNPMA
jgi:DNA-binding NarL/FixJ family response regulator